MTINNPRRDHTVVYEVLLERLSDPAAKKQAEAPAAVVEEKPVFTPTPAVDGDAVADLKVSAPAAAPAAVPAAVPAAAPVASTADIDRLIEEKNAIDVPGLVPQQPEADLPPAEPKLEKLDLMKELAAL